MLARLARAGELAPVRVPDLRDEAVRDLARELVGFIWAIAQKVERCGGQGVPMEARCSGVMR